MSKYWRPEHPQTFDRKTVLATPNYGYEKRQRELAKKKKKEEKLRAKAAGKPFDGSDEVIDNPMLPPSAPADAPARSGDKPD